MIGGASQVRDPVLTQQREHRLHHTQAGTDGLAVAACPRRTTEVRTEELIGGVEEVDLHRPGLDRSQPRARGAGWRGLPAPAVPRLRPEACFESLAAWAARPAA